MAQDMSSQGKTGLSKPSFGAKAPVQENGGFDVTQPAGTHSMGEQYAASPRSAFPATDKSSQDGSGLGNGGK